MDILQIAQECVVARENKVNELKEKIGEIETCQAEQVVRQH